MILFVGMSVPRQGLVVGTVGVTRRKPRDQGGQSFAKRQKRTSVSKAQPGSGKRHKGAADSSEGSGGRERHSACGRSARKYEERASGGKRETDGLERIGRAPCESAQHTRTWCLESRQNRVPTHRSVDEDVPDLLRDRTPSILFRIRFFHIVDKVVFVFS